MTHRTVAKGPSSFPGRVKPSQRWMSPTKVLQVAEVKASYRAPGRRLHRYRLTRTA